MLNHCPLLRRRRGRGGLEAFYWISGSKSSQAVCRIGFTKLDLSVALDTKESFPKGKKKISDGAGAADNNRVSIRITFYNSPCCRAGSENNDF